MYHEGDKPKMSEMANMAKRWDRTLKAIHPYASVTMEDVRAYFDKQFEVKPAIEPKGKARGRR